jgi:hypothetical protein
MLFLQIDLKFSNKFSNKENTNIRKMQQELTDRMREGALTSIKDKKHGEKFQNIFVHLKLFYPVENDSEGISDSSTGTNHLRAAWFCNV